MSNDPEVSKSGVFVDRKTGKVVNKEPEEGVQLVPAGVEIDSIAQAAIEAAKTAASGERATIDQDVETADDKTVTTTTARPKRKS